MSYRICGDADAPIAKNIVTESPTARRFVMVIGYRLLVIERVVGTVVVNGGDAAPARPNNKDKKTTIVCLYPNIFVPLRGFY